MVFFLVILFFFRNREKHLEERFYYTTEKAYFINKYFKYISYTYNILVSCILWHFDVRLKETIRKKTEYVVKTFLISTSLIEYRWWILLSSDIFSLNWKTSWWEIYWSNLIFLTSLSFLSISSQFSLFQKILQYGLSDIIKLSATIVLSRAIH